MKKFRKSYENTIITWLTIIGFPFAIILPVLIILNISPINSILATIIFDSFGGLIIYILFLKGEIKDLKREINNYKNKKEVIKEDVMEKIKEIVK